MKSYEIVYLLNPDLSPNEVVRAAGAITQAIERTDGGIQYVAEPKKRKLAFFVEKAGFAYIGYTDFTLEPEKLEDLKKTLVLDKNFFRFLIVRALKPNIGLIERPYHTRPFRKDIRPKEDAVFKRPKPVEPREQKISAEEIDKKLEEILK